MDIGELQRGLGGKRLGERDGERHAAEDLDREQRHHHRRGDEVERDLVHRHLPLPSAEAGREHVGDGARPDVGAVDGSDALVEGEDARGRQRDREEGDRVRRLGEERQERADPEARGGRRNWPRRAHRAPSAARRAGLAASWRISRPRKTRPMPNTASRKVRAGASRALAKDRPATPSMTRTKRWMSSVAMTTSRVEPTLLPMVMARPLATVSRPLPSMLTTMKVIADVLCTTAPVVKPQRTPAHTVRVHAATVWRKRRPVSFLRFSDRRYIPAKKMPRPPTPWERMASTLRRCPFQRFGTSPMDRRILPASVFSRLATQPASEKA